MTVTLATRTSMAARPASVTPPLSSGSRNSHEEEASSSSRGRKKAKATAIETPPAQTRTVVPAAAKTGGGELQHAAAGTTYPRWHNVVAGAAAGLGGRLLIAPLDLIKIRRQISHSIGSGAERAVGTSSMLQTARAVMRDEGGIRGLYRGNVAASYLWVGYAAVQFALYGRCHEYLSSPAPPSAAVGESGGHFTPATNLWQRCRRSVSSSPTAMAFCSGAAAGVSATLATYPFDVCRTAMASRGAIIAATASSASAAASAVAPPSNMASFARLMIRKNGVGGFFAGSVPAVTSIVPYMGINFALYDFFTRTLEKKQARRVGNAGAAGVVSGGFSKFLVYPMDTVKKRLQAQAFLNLGVEGSSSAGAAVVVGGTSPQYKGMVDCVVRMGREEGVRAFYAGLVPNTLKTAAATGLTFAFFTMTKNALEAIHDGKDVVGKR